MEVDMKKLLILALVLLPCLPGFTLDLGFGADVRINSDSYKEDTSKASAFGMEVRPAVVLMLNPKLEVRPFLILQFTKYSDPDNIAGYIEYSQFGAGIGGGLYYHFIQTNILELSVGLKLSALMVFKPTGPDTLTYTTYSNFSVALELPVNLDFKLTKKLFFRMLITIPGIEYVHQSWTTGGVKRAINDISFQDYLTGFSPFFGFYIML
jgi:hypothetical protein